MMNLRKAVVIFSAALVCFLSGCSYVGSELAEVSGPAESVIEEDEPDTEKLETGKTGTDEKEDNSIADLTNSFDVILEQCTGEFIGNYPMEYAFLMWFYASYGYEAVKQVEAAVEADDMDPELWYELTGNSIHVLWLSFCSDSGFQDEALEEIYRKECANEEETVLDFTGDINLADGMGIMTYLDRCPEGLKDCLSEELLMEMNQADILTVNNEFTYSTRGTPIPGKDYTFRADPSRVELLQEMGVDLAGLANNHTYDYGEEALLDTLDTLTEAGIPYVGAGANLEEASRPVYFVANGRKIAVVAATQIERSKNYTKEATADSAGVLKTLDPEKFVEVIEDAAEDSDLVIAFVHWGTEGNKHYGGDQKALAEKFVKAGADVIIGGHTHCLQGMTYMEDVPVIYSLGNFWFSSTPRDGAAEKDTGMAQLIIEEDGSIKFRFLPCIQKDYRTSLVTEEKEKRRIFDYMESISTGISIDDDGYVTNLTD